MSRPLDDAKRDKIIAAALSVFGENGYSDSTMKDIAMQAEIASGSIYNYFEDKESLFKKTLEQNWQKFQIEMKNIFSADKPYRDKVDYFLDYGFSLLKENIFPLMRGMYTEAVRKGLFHERIDIICEDVDKFLMEGRDQNMIMLLGLENRKRKQLMKIIISGILFSTAIVVPEDLDRELKRIKGVLKEILVTPGVESKK